MKRTLINAFKTIFYKITPSQLFNNSFSQSGEDKIMAYLFGGLHIKPQYLELGTNHPTSGNNTFFFYNHKCHGVLVEADPSLIPVIKKTRPRDCVLNVGVGIDNQVEADFFIFKATGINTFSREEAEYRQTHGTQKILKVIKVPLKTINEIIAANFDTFPDLLSIDIEGLDLDVLKTLDFSKYPIPVICAETCTYSENHIKPKDENIYNFLFSKGYFAYADTYINTIFVNKKWFYKETNH